MEAIQFDPKAKKLSLIKKQIPDKLADNQVLVQVYYAGICGTDLHILDGEFPCKKDGPFVLGHEFSGIVVNIGKNIRHVKVGDRVAADPNTGCNVCINCRNGNPHYCKDGALNTTIGIYVDGGWSQYCLVADVQIVKLPDSITLEQAALCEPISCISHGWDKISPIPIGKKILIIGAGIIGNLFISLLHVQGHKNVTVSEMNKERLHLTERLKTGYDLITPDTLMERQQNDSSYLFDLIIDCSGNCKAIEHAFSLLNYGAKLCMFGVANPAHKISIAPFEIFQKELTLYGITINPFSFPKAIGFIESMGSRYLDYAKLGIEIFALKDYEKAIECLRKGAIAKATFKIH
ncbi:Sorbitol dehydrogenase 1 [Carabus blaptoides fortunei]